MSTVIPLAHQPFVEGLIRSGEFTNEVEVVSAALLKMKEERSEAQLHALLSPALDRLDRGEGLTLDREGLLALRDEIKAGGR